MDWLNIPAKKEFSDSLVEVFLENTDNAYWLEKTVEQFSKDVRMAGLTIEVPLTLEEGFEGVINTLVPFVKDLQSNTANWNNLTYRVDLPKAFSQLRLSEVEWAHLFVLRSFQKVWLRSQFTSDQSKDAKEPTQKDLKP